MKPRIFERVQRLQFVDIETTALDGPDAGTDEIIEIAAATLDLELDEITSSWSTLVAPSRFSSLLQFDPMFGQWHLGEFHGDRFAGVNFQAGLAIDVALESLAEQGYLAAGSTIAGQNPGFDLRHLRRDWEHVAEVAACGGDHSRAPWPRLDYHVIDLVSPAFMLAMTGAVPGCSLRHTAPLLANTRTQKHRAMDDVLDAVEVFRKLARIMARGVASKGPDFMARGFELQGVKSA